MKLKFSKARLKKFPAIYSVKARQLLVFAVLFAVIGGALLIFTRAADYTVSVGPNAPIGVPQGYTAKVFASNVTDLKPRDLQLTPGGTMLVSAMNCAGSCTGSPNDPIIGKVYALPDANKDGVADQKKLIINDGKRLHGIAFYNSQPNKLYVSEDMALVVYDWNEASLTASNRTVLANLTSGGGNWDHHRKSLTINQSTGKLYIGAGSNCDDGREAKCNIGNSTSNTANVLEYDINTGQLRVFAYGMRNAAFLTINPFSNELWVSEMGLENWDILPDDLPPDEINIVRQGRNYGYPQCFGNQMNYWVFSYNCGTTEVPAFNLPAHSSPLGLKFINGSSQFSQYQGKLLVALHGGYSARVGNGDYVALLDVNGNSVSNLQRFINFDDGSGPPNYNYRPVDMEFDQAGSLYITDDVANAVYIVQKIPTTPVNAPDLVVTNIEWTPAEPSAGQAITFSATIQNQGTAATPNNVIHGVRFDVGGQVLWSDTSTSSLAPGASRTVTVNGGNSGSTWTPTAAGSFPVTAWVDDINRIPSESNEGNNTRTESVTVVASGPALAPDLVVTDITWSPASPKDGDNVTFSATIKNQGTAATPAGVIHGVAFSVNGEVYTWSDNHTASLAPGASVTLAANGGLGASTWKATAGNHTVEAWVDNVNRMLAETPKTNNKLTKSLTVTNATPTPSFRPEDINQDGVVNLLDFSILATNFGKSSGLTNPRADINGDGTVNLLDFSLLASKFGT